MKIAYIILAHKHPSQLKRLVNRLDGAEASFFIHIDKRSSTNLFKKVVEELKRLPNVYFCKQHKCYWGDFSLVEATLEGLDEIFRQEVDFDWAIHLSSQDYPIKSNRQIQLFLEKNKGHLYLENFSLPHPNWEKEDGGLNRLSYWHFRLFNKKLRITESQQYYNKARMISFAIPNCPPFIPIKRSLPKEVQPFAGSHYWCLPKESIDYVRKFIAQNPRTVQFFKHTYIPDELFFQTIIMNSPFKHNVVNDHLRYIDWSRDREMPANLNKNDFQKIYESHCLFARKFDVTKDENILGIIDRQILNINP